MKRTLVPIAAAMLATSWLWGYGNPSKLINETPEDYHKRMEWFAQAKLGLFIHWGIYAVKGIDESWAFYNEKISYEDYMKQLEGFTASKYDPEAWAKIIKESGANYAVITTKHHDGVALWNTQEEHFSVVKHTPAKRDLIAPFVKALRKNELKVGLYYSLIDWSHPNYNNFTKSTPRYNYAKDTVRFAKFRSFMFGQIEELGKNYRPDLIWFDGDWEHSPLVWRSEKIVHMLRKYNKEIIVNSRVGAGYGDYGTPEQGVPILRPKHRYWELCYTMNDSWGYQPHDHNYKSAHILIRNFIDCISMGGNLLLDIGPKADGTIPEEQLHILKEFGRWTKKHHNAVFKSIAGIPTDHFLGRTTLSPDSTILYLFVSHSNKHPIMLKGIKNDINRIWVVGAGSDINWKTYSKIYWSKVPGIVYIDLPENLKDPQVTVIAVLLKGKLNLYREYGNAIENN